MAKKRVKGTTLNDEQKRRVRALAVREELRNQEKQGKLVNREALEKLLFKIGREVRDGMENIPNRIAGLLAVERKQEKCHEILLREIRQVLDNMSQALQRVKP